MAMGELRQNNTYTYTYVQYIYTIHTIHIHIHLSLDIHSGTLLKICDGKPRRLVSLKQNNLSYKTKRINHLQSQV